MSVKSLFIGMDGSTFTVLDQLTQGPEPVMPVLAGLLERGARANLTSTPNPLTPPAWVSLMTGQFPGVHGIYDFLKSNEVDGDLYTELSSSKDCSREFIWTIAARNGERAAALNLPFTAPPPRDFDGVILPGFVPWKHLSRNTQPRDFYKRMKKALPQVDPKQLAWDYQHEEKSVQHQSTDQQRDWVTYHLARDEMWFEVAKYVIENESPSLMAVMFDGTDKLQHQVWPYLDPDLAPETPDALYTEMREASLQYFRNVDRYIEGIMALCPDAQVVLSSDHGFTAQTAVFNVNTFLEQKGYLSFRTPEEIAELAQKSGFLTPVNVAASKAYGRTPSTNGIYIRKESDGCTGGVSDTDYESFRDQLIADLKSVIDPRTGKPHVVDVLKAEEAFPGAHMKDAPDLTLIMADSGFISLKQAEDALEQLDPPIGTHHMDGIFIAAGEGIKQGVSLDDLRIVDVAAILLYHCGVPVPEDFDGKVPQALYDPAYLAATPIQTGPASLVPEHMAAAEMSGEEKAQLMEQLAALGYAE
ncbi:MAG: alkaline phosphatase family protein [Mangrovicoccus sp.]|nr:alkaline phosphatase family protein [Mangrovicoccus sp.]